MFNKNNKYEWQYHLVLILVVFLLTLITTPVAAKQIEAGKMLMATVGVTAQQPGAKPRAMQRRSAIYVGDTIKTPEGGRAQLRMADGEMISLTASSELKIEVFDYQPNSTNAKNSSVKNLVTGDLRTITGAVSGNDYEMKTRAGSIGIRGTAFEVYSQQGENLFVSIQRGNVFVKNTKGSVDIGVNHPKMAARITNINQAPEAIPLSDLPKFFEDAFAQDTTLSLAGSEQQKSKPLIFSKPMIEEGLLRTSQGQPLSEIENYIDVAKKPSLGPFGFIVGKDGQGDIFAGQFFKQTISISQPNTEYIFNGQHGSAILNFKNINNFNSQDGTTYLYEVGDSKVYFGKDVDGAKINNSQVIQEFDFVFATIVHDNLASLPASGIFSYNLIPTQLLYSGSLNVNFSTGKINIVLDSFGDIYDGSGSIASFYNGSIILNSYSKEGLITGRFIGSKAEGAIAAYKIRDQQDSVDIVGTALFER